MSADTEFAIVVPLAITDAMLTSSIAEPQLGDTPDPAAWSAATPYVVGDRVRRVAADVHKIFQRLISGTTATAPESDATNWAYVYPTNRWRMFDTVNESESSNADSIVDVLTPAKFADTVVLENLDSNSVQAAVAGSSYDRTIKTKTRACSGWWDYFFQPFRYRKSAVFAGMPPLTSNVITLTIEKTGSVAKCGTCVLGRRRVFGGTRYGATAGIADYSTDDEDQFGNTSTVERAYAKRANITIWVRKGLMPTLHQLLSEYRAKPVFWLGAGDLYEQLVIFGRYLDYEEVIELNGWSLVNLQIKGLT